MKPKKSLGFILGLMYAPFLWGVTELYYYLGVLMGALLVSTKSFTEEFYFSFVIVILLGAVMGLIIVFFPIWFYLRFMNNGKTRNN